MKRYYETPTQIKYRDPEYELMNEENEEDRPWIAGIAYESYIICGCCGGVIELKELFDAAEGDDENEPFDLQFEELCWIDIKDAIL